MKKGKTALQIATDITILLEDMRKLNEHTDRLMDKMSTLLEQKNELVEATGVILEEHRELVNTIIEKETMPSYFK